MNQPKTYETWEADSALLEVPINNIYKGALDVIRYAYETYKDDIIYACSFGVEGIVMIDLISKVNSNAEVVFLDNGFQFPETYDLIKRVEEKYPDLNIIIQKPDLSPSELTEKFGETPRDEDMEEFMYVSKIQPLEKLLKNKIAWFSGLRRTQSKSRQNTDFLNKDERFKKVKICPLIHWTWEDIWDYVHKNNLPYNPLHDKGYPRIACMKTTEKYDGDGYGRAGKWGDAEKTECGLHYVKN